MFFRPHDGVQEWQRAMRTMFLTYLLLIVAGLTYFAVIGLTHH